MADVASALAPYHESDRQRPLVSNSISMPTAFLPCAGSIHKRRGGCHSLEEDSKGSFILVRGPTDMIQRQEVVTIVHDSSSWGIVKSWMTHITQGRGGEQE